jgi:hypothetical protein
MADEALQNGISFISDEKNWSNHLYQQTKVTPLESSVNFNDTYNKPVVIDDPNDDSNMNQFIVQKDKILGGYSAEWKYKFYDPEQGRYVQKTTPILGITSGQQLEKERANAFMSWEEAKEASNELFNNVNR